MNHPHPQPHCEPSRAIHPRSYLQALADLNPHKPDVVRELLATIEFIFELEKKPMLEANILAAYKAEVTDLKAKLAAVPPPPDPATVKDATDLAAEAQAITDLGLSPDGTKPAPAPAPAPPSAA